MLLMLATYSIVSLVLVICKVTEHPNRNLNCINYPVMTKSLSNIENSQLD